MIQEDKKTEIIREYLRWYTLDKYFNKCEFSSITNELSPDMKYYALLKYYLLRVKNDDLNKFHKDETYLDTIISAGFEEILNSKVIKPIKNKNEGRERRKRSKNRKKKNDDKTKETPEYKTSIFLLKNSKL